MSFPIHSYHLTAGSSRQLPSPIRPIMWDFSLSICPDTSIASTGPPGLSRLMNEHSPQTVVFEVLLSWCFDLCSPRCQRYSCTIPIPACNNIRSTHTCQSLRAKPHVMRNPCNKAGKWRLDLHSANFIDRSQVQLWIPGGCTKWQKMGENWLIACEPTAKRPCNLGRQTGKLYQCQ